MFLSLFLTCFVALLVTTGLLLAFGHRLKFRFRPLGFLLAIMVGAVGPRMLRLAATHADEWNIPWRHRLEDVVAEIERVEETCRAIGRDPATLRRSVCLQLNVPDQESSLSDLLRESRVEAINGDAAAIAAFLRTYADAGVSHVQLWIDPMTTSGIEAFGTVLEHLDA